MKTRSLRAGRTLTVATAAVFIGLAAAACQPGAPSAASPNSGQAASAGANGVTDAPAVPPRVSSQASAPGTKQPGVPTNVVAVGQLKFPNTDVDVVFTGYDEKNRLVEFRKVVQDPKSPTAHLVPDPGDPAIHELPVATGTSVKSIDPNGFPFETCPPTACTADNIMESVIGHLNGAFYAHIHVNATDQIDSVAQSAY